MPNFNSERTITGVASASIVLRFCVLIATISMISAPASASAATTEVYATASDGTPLHWVVYTPNGAGPWPAVLVIHGGGYRGGTPGNGGQCAQDLANAGYIAFAIEYRLAPPGSLEGQVSLGEFPDQTDDVKLAVRAARADSRCNRQVGAVGGSAGGSHAAFVAATGTIGDDRIDVGVSLSGGYDFSDFSPNANLAEFTNNVTNYVGVPSTATPALQAASPAWLVNSSVSPLLMINTEADPMPFSQLGDMTTKLDALGVTNYQALTLPGSLHSFDYWPTVKDQAIAFLAAGFGRTPPPPTPSPSPTPDSGTKKLVNVSTRVQVQSGDKVMIGGFIITSESAKRVALRAIGPSLAQAGLNGVLADPILELYDSSGSLIEQNDNWGSLPEDVIASGLTPNDAAESVITATLSPGSYTAVLRGANSSLGIALFELYDLDPASSRVSNISTRGDVGTGDDAMIGGFIIGGSEPTKVLIRAIGPSLAALDIADALQNPVLELRNSDGSVLFANDNWRTDQEQQIVSSGIPPSDDRESAIVATLSPGNYTAVVHDGGNSTGVGLVEVYTLED